MEGAGTALRIKAVQGAEVHSPPGSNRGLVFLLHDGGGGWVNGVEAVRVAVEGKRKRRWSGRRPICWDVRALPFLTCQWASAGGEHIKNSGVCRQPHFPLCQKSKVILPLLVSILEDACFWSFLSQKLGGPVSDKCGFG